MALKMSMSEQEPEKGGNADDGEDEAPKLVEIPLIEYSSFKDKAKVTV